MIFKVDDSQKAGALTVDVPLTIQRAAEFKDTLMKALSSVDRLEVSLDTVTEVDLACLQLLCAAHRFCIRTNKTLIIFHEHAEALHKALRDAGFKRRKGCKNAGGNCECLWIPGGAHE